MPKWLTIVKVVLPTSIAGITTGVMLSIARVIGETAPLLIAAGFTDEHELQPLRGPHASLPVFVYTQYANQGNPPQAYLDRAWAAALTLILIVMALNLIARLVARFFAPKIRPLTPAPERKPVSKRIEVNDLNVYYSKFLAVEGVNLAIEPRSVTAFIGPSGCGKSTFLRTLNRMHEVIPGARVEGEVLIDGNNLYGPGVDPVLVRRQVGMVFQRPNPFPTMSIKENVLAGVKLNNKRISKSDAEELVEKSLRGANLWNEVKDRLDKPGSGLSGGQQQRLCIARAIAVSPEVMLMDEPCSALDPISTLAIEDLIEELKQEYTIVIVTHNMQQASRVVGQDRVLQHRGHGKPGKLIEYDDTRRSSRTRREGDRGLRLGPLRLSRAPVSRAGEQQVVVERARLVGVIGDGCAVERVIRAARRTLETSHAASAVASSAIGMSRYSVARPVASRCSKRLCCVVPCRIAPDGAGVE